MDKIMKIVAFSLYGQVLIRLLPNKEYEKGMALVMGLSLLSMLLQIVRGVILAWNL